MINVDSRRRHFPEAPAIQRCDARGAKAGDYPDISGNKRIYPDINGSETVRKIGIGKRRLNLNYVQS